MKKGNNIWALPEPIKIALFMQKCMKQELLSFIALSRQYYSDNNIEISSKLNFSIRTDNFDTGLGFQSNQAGCFVIKELPNLATEHSATSLLQLDRKKMLDRVLGTSKLSRNVGHIDV